MASTALTKGQVFRLLSDMQQQSDLDSAMRVLLATASLRILKKG
jgi:hypothetical protein